MYNSIESNRVYMYVAVICCFGMDREAVLCQAPHFRLVNYEFIGI